MAERPRIVAVIPARAGSKGIPGKNTRLLRGKPLIQYTMEAAWASGVVDEVVVSSDGSAILALAQRLGATPLVRPAELASDAAPTASAIAHLVEASALRKADIIVLLQPTSPLRRAAHIRAALERYTRDAVPLVSMDESPYYPDKYLSIDEHGRLTTTVPGAATRPRQALSARFKPNGAIYIFSVAQFRAAGDVPIIGSRAFLMDKIASIDIDAPEDLRLVELILENSHVFDCRP